MSKNKIFIIISVVIFFLFFINNNFRNKENVAIEISEVEGLTTEQYENIKGELIKIVNEQNPKIALEKISTNIKTDKALLESCHAIVHEIGHEAYKKYKSFGEAMNFQSEICNSAYIHGIIESRFTDKITIDSEINTICNEYPIGKFISWQCFHGVGHGIMYYNDNNLPLSIDTCNKYDNPFSKYSCLNGVYMENFNVDQKIHISKYLKKDNLFYPCDEQKLTNKPICYLYAPTYYLSLNKKKYTESLKWCEKTEFGFRNFCAYGVGSQAIKENINDPKIVEKICMSGKRSQTYSCINGMVNLYINNHGSLGPAIKLCGELEKKNQKSCNDAIESSSSLFL